MGTWTSQIVMDAVKALMCPRGCVKHDAIVKHTGLKGRQVADACAKLVEHKYLEREVYADCSVKPGCYRLTKLGLAALEEGARLTSGPKGPTGKVRPSSSLISIATCRVARPAEPIFSISRPASMKLSPLPLSVRPYASMYRALMKYSEKARIRDSGVFSPPPTTHLKELTS